MGTSQKLTSQNQTFSYFLPIFYFLSPNSGGAWGRNFMTSWHLKELMVYTFGGARLTVYPSGGARSTVYRSIYPPHLYILYPLHIKSLVRFSLEFLFGIYCWSLELFLTITTWSEPPEVQNYVLFSEICFQSFVFRSLFSPWCPTYVLFRPNI